MYETDVIKLFSDKGLKLSLVLSGGGMSILDLFKVSGCSKLMTEAQVLYDEQSYKRFFIDFVPDCGFVSQEMADAMAFNLYHFRKDTIAIAVTAALKTTRVLRGGTRAHISIVRDDKIIYSAKVDLTGGDRYAQDAEIKTALYQIIAEKLL